MPSRSQAASEYPVHVPHRRAWQRNNSAHANPSGGTMISLENTEPYFGSKDRNEAWVAEAIWGHRLERQPFSALLLEFLGMAEGMYRQGKLLEQTRPGENPTFTANRCLQ